MTIIDTVWEPHTFPVTPYQPPTTADELLRNHLTNPHKYSLTHSIHTHLPWHRRLHGTTPDVCPETDIHETAQAYHIEIALAGFSDKNSVLVQWRAPRTLIVQGGLTKLGAQIDHMYADFVRSPPNEGFGNMLKKVSVSGNLSEKDLKTLRQTEAEACKNGEKGEIPVNKSCTDEYVADLCVEEGIGSRHAVDATPLFILKERKLGLFQRTFTLPVDVSFEDCEAKLNHGLLKIDIPKREPQKQQEDPIANVIGS